MTKTEAAEILALELRLWSRRTGQPITPLLTQERMGEARYGTGLFPLALATGVSWRTVYRRALADQRLWG